MYSHIRGMMTGRVWENNRIADDSWDDSKKKWICMVDIPKIQGRLLDQGSSEPSSNADVVTELQEC